MNKFLLLLYFTVLLFILHSCANRQTPSGGPKDVEAPKIISTYPKNKTLNFNEKEILFEFDEYIKEDKFFEKTIVSPALDTTFTFKIAKNRLTLKFVKNFSENTTYTINLGEGIKDITENNSGKDLSLTFSTGNYLDSLNIKGKVFDINTGKPLEAILIGLYRVNDTLNVFNSKPLYISRSDKQGMFTLENLRKDSYSIYAWQDNDRNLKYTNQTEPIGFLSDTLKLDSNIVNLKIPIQRFDLRQLKVLRTDTKEDGPTIEFNKGISEQAFKLLEDSTKKILYTFNKEKTIFQLFNTFDFKDSVLLQITAKDSFEIKTDTTIKVAFQLADEKRKSSKKEDNEEERKTFSIKFKSQTQILSSEEVDLLFDYPIKTYSLDSVYFYKDSLTKYPVTEEDFIWNDNYTILDNKKQINFKDTLRLFIGTGSFITVRGDSNKRLDQLFLIKNPSQFSAIGGEVQISATDYIIQLTKKDSKQTFEVRNQKKFRFDYLEPGIYSIKVLIDENKNGVWDRGSLKDGIAPERIIYFPIVDSKGKETPIKANWEILENIIKDSE